MAKESNIGIVYVLINECMQGLVKIGMTSRDEMKERLGELYSTGVPMPFECVYACKVENYKELEKALHTAFEPYRVNPAREFFRIKPSQAVALLQFIDGSKGKNSEKNITAEVVRDMEQIDDEKEPHVVEQKRKNRAPINLFEMGLKEGDTLVYVHDNSITCEVVDTHKVRFNGEITYLSPITTKLLGAKMGVQPTPHWEYNGQNLRDLYEDWQARLLHEEEDESGMYD